MLPFLWMSRELRSRGKWDFIIRHGVMRFGISIAAVSRVIGGSGNHVGSGAEAGAVIGLGG
jgi:hypothetical protein